MKFIAIVLSILIATPIYGCPNQVTLLEIGEKAPCKGYLFSPEKEKEVRYKLIDVDSLKTEIVIKDKMIRLYKLDSENTEKILSKERDRVEVWKDTSLKLGSQLTKQQEYRSIRDWMFFVGGILTTIGAGVALGQANK